MAKCDLCCRDCSAVNLVQLLDNYQVDGVADVCPICAKWANKAKSDMLLEIAPRMRAAIAARKVARPASAARALWRRFTIGIWA